MRNLRPTKIVLGFVVTVLLAGVVNSAGGSSAVVDPQALLKLADVTKLITSADSNKAIVIHDKRFGLAVDLHDSLVGTLQLDTPLHTNGGTISFWIKPHWQAGSDESHTLLSGLWSGGRKSYLAISEGWWEPTGVGRLYFIASNEDFVHCSSDARLPTQTWSLITVTWAAGAAGYCKLYVDDELRASSVESIWSESMTIKSLNIGSDDAASNRRGRKADATIAVLKILSYPVSQEAVIRRYDAEEDAAARYAKKWAWLDIAKNHLPKDGNSRRNSYKWAIFDEDFSWAESPASVDARLNSVARAGFNIYVPCVWHGRGAYFPTEKARPERMLSDQIRLGWDPLAYVVAQAHKRGIEVHPWFTVARREDDEHPEWTGVGVPTGAYDMQNAAFRQFIVELMMDVVDRYQVDGINLDYIRTMGVCTSTSCQANYRMQMGADLLKDYSLLKDYALLKGAPSPGARSRIQTWQDMAVAGVVKEFSTRARSVNPRLLISVDGFATPSQADRPLEGRDEINWANQGWIDVIFHMDYRPTLDLKRFEAARSMLTDPEKLWFLIANYDLIDDVPTPRSGKWVASVLEAAENSQYGSGIGVYIINQLNSSQTRALAPRARSGATPTEARKIGLPRSLQISELR
jgi:hypothetical protein